MAKGSLIILWCLFPWIISDENYLRNQEDDPAYEAYQRVKEMVSNQPTVYLLYRNFQLDGLKCMYIKFGNEGSSGVYPSAVLGYMSSSKMETREVTISTATTPYPNHQDSLKKRLGPNALVYKKIQEDGEMEESAKSYPLIYSDYKSCTVIRVPEENGNYGCEMYVSSPSTQPSPECETLYRSSCGRVKNEVWNTECDQALEDAGSIVWDE